MDSYGEFSSKERFTNYLTAERKWRYGTENKVNVFLSTTDDVPGNYKSGFAQNMQRLQVHHLMLIRRR